MSSSAALSSEDKLIEMNKFIIHGESKNILNRNLYEHIGQIKIIFTDLIQGNKVDHIDVMFYIGWILVLFVVFGNKV